MNCIIRWILRRRAVINRYGFNSDGIDAVGQRLAAYRRSRWALPPGYVPLLTTAGRTVAGFERGLQQAQATAPQPVRSHPHIAAQIQRTFGSHS